MDAKQALIVVLKALTEIKEALPKGLLIDLLMGRGSKEITEQGYDETDVFGSGEGRDEDFWNNLVEAAITAGHIKAKTVRLQNLVITASGKKFLKNPETFVLKDEEEFSEDIKDVVLDDFEETVMTEKKQAAPKNGSSARTRTQIRIIQAIDRKIALDDFAEDEGIELDEILNELEKLVQMKMHIDITYFTDEILGENSMEELLDYFEESEDDSIDIALKEYGDVYNVEEIRLARIVYRCSKL